MKESINTIATYLDGDILELAKDAKNKLGEQEHMEMTISEAYSQIKLLLDVLKLGVEKGYLEKVSVNRRNNIGAQLSTVASALNIIKQNSYDANYQTRQAQASYIQGVYGLKETVDDAKLFEMSKSFGNYYHSLEKLSATEDLYQENLSKIAKTKEYYEIAYKRLHLLNEKIKVATQTVEDVDKVALNAKRNDEKVDELLTSSKASFQDIENKRVKIEAFHKNVDETEETIQTLKEADRKHKDDTKIALDKLSEDANKHIAQAINKTNSVVAENLELQKELGVLLRGATAGKLYTEFKKESDKIRNELWFWLVGVLLINAGLLAFSSLMIFGSETLGIKALDISSMTAIAFVKVFLSVPILLLDWFIVRQYNIRRILMEKYTFKSLMSISLIHYNDLVKENIKHEESSGFIISTIDKIYSSPFDIVDNKTTAAISALTDKSAEIIGKIAEKAIDKVK
jgi:hypothetical protein